MAPTLYDLKEMMAHEVESATTGPVKDDPARVARLRSEWIEHLKRSMGDGGVVQPPDGYEIGIPQADVLFDHAGYTPLSDRDPDPQAVPSGVKYDGGKDPMFRIAIVAGALGQVARVLDFGAKKYPAADNWKKVDRLEERYASAALRHLFASIPGPHFDQETGIDALAHALCCLLFLLQHRLEQDLPEGPLSK